MDYRTAARAAPTIYTARQSDRGPPARQAPWRWILLALSTMALTFLAPLSSWASPFTPWEIPSSTQAPHTSVTQTSVPGGYATTSFTPPWSSTQALSIFISSVQYTGAFGGLEVARQNCQNLANQVPTLAGTTWYPLLSDATWDARSLTGLSAVSSPIYNMNGSVIASTRAALWNSTNTNLTNGVKYDESGTTVNDFAFTGSSADGLRDSLHCDSWTNASASAIIGSSNDPSNFWFEGLFSSCTFAVRIYCIGDYNPLVGAPTATPTSATTATPTRTPTRTPTNTPTATPSRTPTRTPTATPSRTPTSTPTSTVTQTPNPAFSSTPTPTPTRTPTITPTATNTSGATPTPTRTFTSTPTGAATQTPTHTPSATPATSQTATPTPTSTPTATRTPTSGPTPITAALTFQLTINGAPAPGAPVKVQSTPVNTSSLGYFNVTVPSSQSITIETGLPAISFTPVSGIAGSFIGGTNVIPAIRLVSPGAQICSTMVGSTPSIYFPYSNTSGTALTVPLTYPSLNRIVSQTGMAAPAQLFAPGLTGNGFTLPASLFASGTGYSGSWQFLATSVSVPSNPITCASGGTPSDCKKVSFDPVFESARGIISYLSTECIKEAERGAWKPKGDFRGPFYAKGASALKNLRAFINTLGSPVYSCTTPPSGNTCAEVTVDKSSLRRIFNSIFTGAIPDDLKRVKALIPAQKKAFEKTLSSLPSSVYYCSE